MSSDEKLDSSVDIGLYTPEDSPEPPASPKGQVKADSELVGELLASKTPPSNPSDVDQPPSIHPESSGSDQYSDEKNVSSKAHSRLHSRGRSTSDFHVHSNSKMQLPPPPAFMPVVSERTPIQDRSYCVPRAHSTSPTHSSAPSTPLVDNTRTYSFVFTSSRQNRVFGGDRLIGVVNPSSTRSLTPKGLPRPQNTARKPSLTPEQIKAHALGAVHATPEGSPFAPLAKRDRPVPLVTPIEIPIRPALPLTLDSQADMDKSTQSIDYYVNAVRAGRNVVTESPSSPRPAIHRRSLSYTASLPALGEHNSPAIFEETPTPAQNEQARTKRKKSKSYSRYVESESQEFSFASTAVVRPRGQSHDSSASSSNSKASFDESITGLSCFGVIGRGTPAAVFGNAVMSARHSKRGNQRPTFSQTSSSASSSYFSQTEVPRSASSQTPTPSIAHNNNIAQNAAIDTPQ